MRVCLAALLATLLGACASAGSHEDAPVMAPDAATAPPAPAAAMPGPSPGQDAEILPLIVPMASHEPFVPTDPASLLLEADKARNHGRIEEALSILDTLLILEPESADLLERRAALLKAAGKNDDAAEDLQRCCALERLSCCGPSR